MPIYYVVAEEKTVLEAVLMGEACVLPPGPSDPALEHYVRVCHGGRVRCCYKKRGLFSLLDFAVWMLIEGLEPKYKV
jgi:hypothetical protein